MGEPFQVLFVCVGNVCRSPVAERLLRSRLEQAGLSDSFSVASAGTRALAGREMSRESMVELRMRKGSAEGFIARRLSESLVMSADLVLTATLDVRRVTLGEAPGALRRCFTWREFAALVDQETAVSPQRLVAEAAARRAEVGHLELDTEDPIGRSREVHARVAEVIDQAVTPIAHALARSTAP